MYANNTVMCSYKIMPRAQVRKRLVATADQLVFVVWKDWGNTICNIPVCKGHNIAQEQYKFALLGKYFIYIAFGRLMIRRIAFWWWWKTTSMKLMKPAVLVRWFLRKKVVNDFLETYPECSLLIPVLRTTKKISHRACFNKRYNGPILPHWCLYWY